MHKWIRLNKTRNADFNKHPVLQCLCSSAHHFLSPYLRIDSSRAEWCLSITSLTFLWTLAWLWITDPYEDKRGFLSACHLQNGSFLFCILMSRLCLEGWPLLAWLWWRPFASSSSNFLVLCPLMSFSYVPSRPFSHSSTTRDLQNNSFIMFIIVGCLID